MKALQISFAFLVIGILALSTSAALVAQEDFEGCNLYQWLNGEGSGSGWSGAWTAPYAWADSAKIHTLDGEVTKLVSAGLYAGGGEAHAYFDRMLASTQSGTVYFSVKLKKYAADAGSVGFIIGSGADGNVGAQIAIDGNVYKATVSGQSSSSTATYTAGTDVTLVGKLSYSGASATLDMWVDPTDVETGGTYVTVTNTAAGFSSVDRAWIATWNNDTLGFYDDILIGTTWGDVAVPEPATMTLLAVGGLGMLIRRKK